MITRAQIRRQLRKNGGIMNAVPRQGYFLGKIVKGVKKIVDPAIDVVTNVAKSPVGKAALLGAGLYGLGGGFGGNFGLGNIGPKIGQGLSAARSGLFGSVMPNVRAAGMPSFLGETGFTRTGGLLGKLGLTKGGGSMMPTPLGGMTAAGLLTYFMAKGKTEEEAENLAQDVYRGKGLGMDLIKSDMQKYRSGILSGSQAHDMGYHFLTPRNYLGAQGGRVGLYAGTPKEGIKSLEAGASSIKVEGDVRPENMKMAGISKDPNDPIYKGINPKIVIEFIQEGIPLGYSSPQEYFEETPRNYLGAQGGRVGLKKGTKGKGPHGKTDKEVLKELYPTLFSDTTTSIEGSPGKKKYYKGKAQGGRIGKYGGGIGAAMPRIPTGMPRVNAGGITELDYRQEGGFVPMGVKEKADDVPAMLSKNEFVMTADAVKAAGGGDVEKGAQRMYDTMKMLEGRVA